MEQSILVRPAENECIFWTFTEAFGSFRRFRRVVKAYLHVAVYRYEYIRRPINGLIFIKTEYVSLFFNSNTCAVYTMQKDLIPVINSPLCCMNWYSLSIIRSSHRIRTRSHRICIVVKFYNHTLRLRYGCIPLQYFPLSVLLELKHSSKINARQQIVARYKQLSV